MLVTMVISAVGVHRTLSRRLQGGWAFALSFRREVSGSLDVSYTPATTLPPSRRCRLIGTLLDELLLITKLAPLLETNSRAEPCEKLYAADASSSGAGGCFASIAREDWLALCEFAEEEQVSTFALIGQAKNPRAACAMHGQPLHHLLLKLNWTTLFSVQFFAGKHINLLELESVISLFRRITRKAALGTCGLARGLASCLKVTIGLTKSQLLASKTGVFGVSLMTLHWSWYGCTWANPADAPSRGKPIESWYASLPKLPSTPTGLFASDHVLSELDLLREPLSVAAHTAGEHVRELESSGTFSCSEAKPAHVETATSQVTRAGETIAIPSNVRQLPRKGVKSVSKDEKAERAADCSLTPRWPRNDPIFIAASWFRASPGFRSACGITTGSLAKRITVSKR